MKTKPTNEYFATFGSTESFQRLVDAGLYCSVCGGVRDAEGPKDCQLECNSLVSRVEAYKKYPRTFPAQALVLAAKTASRLRRTFWNGENFELSIFSTL